MVSKLITHTYLRHNVDSVHKKISVHLHVVIKASNKFMFQCSRVLYSQISCAI